MNKLREAAQAVAEMFPEDLSNDSSCKIGWSDASIAKIKNLRAALAPPNNKIQSDAEKHCPYCLCEFVDKCTGPCSWVSKAPLI